jgi:hypothetical protein
MRFWVEWKHVLELDVVSIAGVAGREAIALS